ncbi:hypothetical protein Q3G72_011468 [Acer saccharum]|nr:hypothetical protein Q3G72_011468 [Acer saccharum]
MFLLITITLSAHEFEVPTSTRKRNITEYDEKSSSFETNNTQLDAIAKLTHSIDKLNHTINSIATKEHSSWDRIKEIPKLDNYAQRLRLSFSISGEIIEDLHIKHMCD